MESPAKIVNVAVTLWESPERPCRMVRVRLGRDDILGSSFAATLDALELALMGRAGFGSSLRTVPVKFRTRGEDWITTEESYARFRERWAEKAYALLDVWIERAPLASAAIDSSDSDKAGVSHSVTLDLTTADELAAASNFAAPDNNKSPILEPPPDDPSIEAARDTIIGPRDTIDDVPHLEAAATVQTNDDDEEENGGAEVVVTSSTGFPRGESRGDANERPSPFDPKTPDEASEDNTIEEETTRQDVLLCDSSEASNERPSNLAAAVPGVPDASSAADNRGGTLDDTAGRADASTATYSSADAAVPADHHHCASNLTTRTAHSEGSRAATPRRVVVAAAVSAAAAAKQRRGREASTPTTRKRAQPVRSGNKKKPRKSDENECPKQEETPKKTKTPPKLGRLQRQTVSSRKKRLSQAKDRNEHRTFEECIGNKAKFNTPRTTAHNAPRFNAAELEKSAKTAGGATAQRAERKMQEQQIRALQEQYERAREELQKLRDLQTQMAIDGSCASTATATTLSLDEIETALRDATRRLVVDGDQSAADDCDKYGGLLAAHPEHRARLENQRKLWDEEQAGPNREALLAVRRFVPPRVKEMTRDDLLAAGLPSPIAHRVAKTKVLRLCRTPQLAIARMHVAILRSYDVSNLSLVELRAVYASLPPSFENDSSGEKAAWREKVREKLVAAVNKQGTTCSINLDDLPKLFDPDSDCDEQPEEINVVVKSGLDGQAKARRDEELMILIGRRRKGHSDSDDDGNAASKQHQPVASKNSVRPPNKFSSNDPRASMLAAVVARKTPQQPQAPAFLGELLSLKKKRGDGAPRPQAPAFLGELLHARLKKLPPNSSATDATATTLDDDS